MDEVVNAQCELAGGVSCCCGRHDEAKGGRLIPLGRSFFVGKVSEHASEMLVNVS